MAQIDELAKEFLAQQRIAVAGVSRSTDSTALGIYNKLKTTGHTVFAINPNATEVAGEVCYPNLRAIPGGVDGVVTVTTPEATEQIVKQCIEAGVKRVWMHRSIGNSVSDKAVALGQQNGITVIAGGCPMMFQAPVDFGHICLKWWCGATGKLPQ